MSRSERRTNNVREKLEKLLEEGKFYEAEQTYQTLFAR
jgi:acetyl-CoA carboxylase carboxyltransferase component